MNLLLSIPVPGLKNNYFPWIHVDDIVGFVNYSIFLKNEYGIIWNDPNINIIWRIDNPIISTKDLKLPYLNKQKNLPKF